MGDELRGDSLVHLNVRFSTEAEMKQTLDFLYEKSKEGIAFTGLVEAMVNEVTIVTAIHNIKWSSRKKMTMRHWNARKMVASNGVQKRLNIWEITGISLRDALFTRSRMKDVYSIISSLTQMGFRRYSMFKMLSWDAAGTSASLCGKGRLSAVWPVSQLCPVA